MKITHIRVRIVTLALAFACAPIAIRADELRIQSFDNTGVLTFSRIATGQAYHVESATSLTGAWTRLTNAVTIDGIPTTMDCIPGQGGIATGAVPVQASSMFFRAVADTNDMVLIPAGVFVMGATHETNGDDLPRHLVYVSAFYMDRYEATKERWWDVYLWATNHGYTNWGTSGVPYMMAKAPNHPMYELTWWDCARLCNARSEMEGLTPCYRVGANVFKSEWVHKYINPCDCDWNANGYRLPTEAEWEKAARGGVSGHRFPWSDADNIRQTRANYFANNNISYDTNPTTGYHPAYSNDVKPFSSPVGSFAPNGYGLYDMAGNMEEWLWDYYSGTYYSTSPTSNPHGPPPDMFFNRVTRGGSYESPLHPGEWCVSVRSQDRMHRMDLSRTFRSVRACTNSPADFPPATNRPPVILEGASVSVTMSEDSTPTAFWLTLHATDAENDLITWWVPPQASHGKAVADGSGTTMSIVYEPATNYNGGDSFEVQAYDRWGAMASIVVNVTVDPVNDAPEAYDQCVAVMCNTPQTITLTGADIIEGSAIAYYAVVTPPMHGVLVGGPFTFAYTPQTNYLGLDGFSFTANDGTTDSAPATVSISVGAMAALGGTITNYTSNGTNYTAHIFTTVGATNLTIMGSGDAEVLVVAGGGGGGRSGYLYPEWLTSGGGGGGAGGLIYTNAAVESGSYLVVVGAGGVGSGISADTATAGANSSFGQLIALGGGCGSRANPSGGGGSGAGGYGQGMAGGPGIQPGGFGTNGGAGAAPGGGGGAGSAGSAGFLNNTNNWSGGRGGSGQSNDISGVWIGYAGGGGGGGVINYYSGGTATDGGGIGGAVSGGGSGLPSTGGGGGGGGMNDYGAVGGAGGSGIVIVRYGIAVP